MDMKEYQKKIKWLSKMIKHKAITPSEALEEINKIRAEFNLPPFDELPLVWKHSFERI